MSFNSRLAIALAALGVTAVGGCELFQSHGDPKLAALAKISYAQASAIATALHAGKIKEWELEQEAGGSGLRYSFDILSDGKIYEVGVDAADGKVLENGIESEEDEEREEKEDKAGKH
jgi:uncharacterized membrane protein YkoI